MPASGNGMPKTVVATMTAVTPPAMAHQWGRTRRPASRPNSTRIGRAATSVERSQLCNGSYTWVQAIAYSSRGRVEYGGSLMELANPARVRVLAQGAGEGEGAASTARTVRAS